MKRLLSILVLAALLMTSAVIAVPAFAEGTESPVNSESTDNGVGAVALDEEEAVPSSTVPEGYTAVNSMSAIAEALNDGATKLFMTADIEVEAIDTTNKTGFELDGNYYSFIYDGDAAVFSGATGYTVKKLTLKGSLAADAAAPFADSSNVTFEKVVSEVVITYANGNRGGVVATVSGISSFTNVQFKGTMPVAYTNYVGGIVGNATGTVTMTGCKNYANLTGRSVGGMVGYSSTSGATVTLEDCYNYGNITTESFVAGGMTGYMSATVAVIRNCVNGEEGTVKGKISAIAGGSYIGGISGALDRVKEVSDCTNYGEVTSGSNGVSVIGGIAGHIMNNGNFADCTVSYNTNYGTVYVGGFTNKAGGLFASITAVNVIGNTNAGAFTTGVCQDLGGIAGVINASKFNDNTTTAESSVTLANNGYRVGGMIGTGTITEEFKNNVNNGAVNATPGTNAFTNATYVAGIGANLTLAGTVDGNKNNGAITVNATFNNRAYVGGIFAYVAVAAEKTIKSFSGNINGGPVTLSGTVANECDMGGVVGNVVGVVNFNNNQNTAALIVNSANKASTYFGGIGGYFTVTGECTGNVNSGSIKVEESAAGSGWMVVGGIGGHAKAPAYTNCDNTGIITVTVNDGRTGIFVAGITGITQQTATFTDCDMSGEINVTGNSSGYYTVGGFIGWTDKTIAISKSTNAMDITVDGYTTSTSQPLSVGGFVGYTGVTLTVTNSANGGNVSTSETLAEGANASYAGGIAGYANEENLTITGTTNTGAVTGNVANELVGNAAPKFVISFNGAGAEGSMADVELAAGDYTLPNSEFTVPAHKYFGGWTVNGEAKNVGDTIQITGDVTITAIWKDLTYTVSYKDDANAENYKSATTVAGDYVLAENTFEAPAHKYFAGWSVNGETMQVGDTIQITDNVTVIAVWADVEYTVSFNANGGNGEMDDVTVYAGDYTLPEIGFTAPAGKQFFGWALTENGEVVGDVYDVTDDVTFYAIWVANVYTVSYDENDGDSTESRYWGTQAEEGVYTLASAPQFSNPVHKYFVGWSLTPNGEIITEYELTSDVTFYAVYAYVKYTVSFNTLVDGKTMDPVEVTYGDTMVVPNVNFTYAHHSFLGWSADPDNHVSYEVGSDYVVEGEVTFYAVWEAVEYTVTYADGEASKTDSAVAGDYTLLDNTFAAPAHKTFAGWNVNGVNYAAGETIEIAGDVTVTAVWADVEYTVSFNGAGAQGTMTDVKVNVGAYELPANAFAYAHKTFAGWLVNGETYAAGETIEIAGDVTVTAVWDDVKYTVSFNANGGDGEMTDAETVAGAYTLPENGFTTPAGKKFLGWATTADGSVVGSTYQITGDVTFYAVWIDVTVKGTLVTYTVAESYEIIIPATISVEGEAKTFGVDNVNILAGNTIEVSAASTWKLNDTVDFNITVGDKTVSANGVVAEFTEDTALKMTAGFGASGKPTVSGTYSGRITFTAEIVTP